MGGIIGAPTGLPFLDRCIELLTMHLRCGVFNTRAWMAAGPGVINAELRKDQTTHPIKKRSFSKMLNGMVSYRRTPGVSNSWAKNQLNGIIDPARYANGFHEIASEKTKALPARAERAFG